MNRLHDLSYIQQQRREDQRRADQRYERMRDSIRFYYDRRSDDQYMRLQEDRFHREQNERIKHDRPPTRPSPNYVAQPYHAPLPTEDNSPTATELMRAVCCGSVSGPIFLVSATLLCVAPAFEPDAATKVYIAGSLGIFGALTWMLSRAVPIFNRDNPNRSTMMNCIVRFASILTAIDDCRCNDPEYLPY